MLNFHCPINKIFTAEAQRAQRKSSFSFADETPANKNHHAFGNLDAY
jgi:hypothetical protein